MITFTGKRVFPASPENAAKGLVEAPSIEDIAVGLGRQPRFCGQTREDYNVLCHVLTCAQIAREFWPDEHNLRRWLAMHDAHECVLSDRVTTWGDAVTEAKKAELDDRIAIEHSLPPLSDGGKELLKQVDYDVLRAEAHALGHRAAEEYWPRDLFNDIAERAFEITVLHLQVGNPIALRHPDNAIRAFREALR